MTIAWPDFNTKKTTKYNYRNEKKKKKQLMDNCDTSLGQQNSKVANTNISEELAGNKSQTRYTFFIFLTKKKLY